MSSSVNCAAHMFGPLGAILCRCARWGAFAMSRTIWGAGRAEIAMAGYTVNSVSCGANCAARDAVSGDRCAMCEKGAVSKRQCALPSLLRHSMNSMFLLFFGFLSHFPCFVRDAPIGPAPWGSPGQPTRRGTDPAGCVNA